MKRLLIPLLFVFSQSALASESELLECRQIEKIAERVACYDSFVDSRFPPDAQSLFGTSDAEAKRVVETSLDIEQISEIVAVVTEVRKSTTKRLTVTLDNGQIWRQIDSQRMSLKDGDTVVVRKASLGSFLLNKKSSNRSIRVKRLN